jgi:streptogramin lyase
MPRLQSVIAIGLFASSAFGQGAPNSPTNDAPNPFRSIEGWAKMPEGRKWGSTSAVDIDKDGESIWVAERCGANSCVGSPLDPVLKFDKTGKLVKSFGAGMIQSPHGIHIDKDGNVWIVDCSCTGGGGGRGGRGGGRGGDTVVRANAAPPPPAAGHQIYKFSPDGQLLMTLGKAGGGRDAEYFTQPNDVLTAPNGDIYVVEGHSSNAATATARLYKFDKTGKLITVIGKFGKGDGEYDQPHALAMDSKGRLFVADRGNNRLLIYDQNLKLLDTWYQFSRISGLFIDKNDVLYAADSESETVNPAHSDWKRGIRIGSLKDGKVTAFIPDPWSKCAEGQTSSADAPCSRSTSAAEGVAVDKNGVIYGAEVGPMRLMRYEKK